MAEGHDATLRPPIVVELFERAVETNVITLPALTTLSEDLTSAFAFAAVEAELALQIAFVQPTAELMTNFVQKAVETDLTTVPVEAQREP